jgi:hypothetical protein
MPAPDVLLVFAAVDESAPAADATERPPEAIRLPAHASLLRVWSGVLRDILDSTGGISMQPGAADHLPELPAGSLCEVDAWRLALALMNPPDPCAASGGGGCPPVQAARCAREAAGGTPSRGQPLQLTAATVLPLLRLSVKWDMPGIAAHCKALLLSPEARCVRGDHYGHGSQITTPCYPPDCTHMLPVLQPGCRQRQQWQLLPSNNMGATRCGPIVTNCYACCTKAIWLPCP